MKTEGYSGADIELLCRESAMRPVRRLMTQLQSIPEHPLPIPAPPVVNSNISNNNIKNIKLLKQAADDVDVLLRSDPVTQEDMLISVTITKPSSDGKLLKYE